MGIRDLSSEEMELVSGAGAAKVFGVGGQIQGAYGLGYAAGAAANWAYGHASQALGGSGSLGGDIYSGVQSASNGLSNAWSSSSLSYAFSPGVPMGGAFGPNGD